FLVKRAAFSNRANTDSFGILVLDGTGVPSELPPASVDISRKGPVRFRIASGPSDLGQFLLRGGRTLPADLSVFQGPSSRFELVLPDSKNPRLGIRGLCWDRAFPS